MSLAEKWEETRKTLNIFDEEEADIAKRAFYAGAEAVDSEYRRRSMALTEFEAEIDHFRNHQGAHTAAQCRTVNCPEHNKLLNPDHFRSHK